MAYVRGIWIDGRIIPSGPVDWPEGSELVIYPVAEPVKLGLTEDEWSNDAESIAAWETWMHSIEPRELSADERLESSRFQAEFDRFNLTAVRKQMEFEDDT